MKRIIIMKRFYLSCLFLALSLCGYAGGSGGNDVDHFMRLSGNIHQFNEIFPQEKVWLEFDNTAYFQGETIWFKAFVTHATTLKRAPSKVLYVELLTPSGIVAEKLKLKVIAGQADGAFSLMDVSTRQAREKRGVTNYPSGYYEIRAYTQNMLDFPHEASFSRIFPVYTAPKHQGKYEESKVVDEKEPEATPIRPLTEEPERKVNVSFFPEGGNIVAGLPCNIAFKATGIDGKPLDGEISFTSSDGTAPAATEHDGMGSFRWIQKKPSSETVRFRDSDGKEHRVSLPKAIRSGYSMIVTGMDDSTMTAKLYRTQDRTEDMLGLAVTCRGELIHFDEISFSDSTDLNIDCSGWPIGVCRMTLYSENGEIFSTRSLFHNNTSFNAPSINVISDSLTHKPFGRQALKLTLTDNQGNPIRDRFCISVRDPMDYGNGYGDNLMTNLLLSSDLKGYIRDPQWYLASHDAQHRRALDLLTLVQGWERYEWEYTTGQTDFHERHRTEDSLTLNGWILSLSKREPVDGMHVQSSVIPKDKSRFSRFDYQTDTTGYFGFDLMDFTGEAKTRIILARYNKRGKIKYPTHTRIQLDRSDLPSPRMYNILEKDLVEHNGKRIDPADEKKKQEDNSLPTVIYDSLGILLDEVDIDEKRQFIDFDTFEVLDAVADTEFEMDKGEFSSDVYDYLHERGYNFYQPLYFYVHDSQKAYIDQKPFEDPMSIDMMDVKSILVFDDAAYLKHLSDFMPLLNELQRKRGNIDYFIDMETDWTRYRLIDIQVKDEWELSPYKDIYNLSKRNTTVDGFSQLVEFYSPEYPNGPVHGDIDTRRTIYWNPNVVTDSTGTATVRFYNNSYSRSFQISGAGITASGTPYVLSGEF